MYDLDILNDAIAAKHKISFTYNDVDIDFKLKPRRDEEYIVNPYQIVAANGRFYLIGNYDKYNNVSHYRIDRMTDIKDLGEKAKPIKLVKELENGLNLPKHMAEHIYMFSGQSAMITLKTTKDMFSELVDWFGKDIVIKKIEDKEITVRVNCNENAMRYWALQYGPYVEVIEPKSLRQTLKEDISHMYEKYN